MISKKKKKKKKVFAKIQSDFSAEIQNSNVFSAQNQVISKKKNKKKKKGLRQNSEYFFGRNPKFKRFFRPKSSDLQKKKVFAKIQSDFSAEIQNSNVFSAQNQVISKKKKKKKKKKVFAKIQGDFSSKISQVQTFQGGLFSHGGGYFQFFTENRPQKHKIHAILHTSQDNGGGLETPPPPPWLRYCS